VSANVIDWGLLTARRTSHRLARLKAETLAVLRADGVLDLIGPDHVHGNVDRAVQAELTALGTQV
jgi:hypothetical protein